MDKKASDVASRHCIEIATWTHVGVQEFYAVEPRARLWVWPSDVDEAISSVGI